MKPEQIEQLKRIQDLGGDCRWRGAAIQPIDPTKRTEFILTDLASAGLVEITITLTDAGRKALADQLAAEGNDVG